VLPNLNKSRPVALIIGLTSIVFLFGFKKLFPKVKKFPTQLVVIVVATIITVVFNLDDDFKLKTIGSVPSGLRKYNIVVEL